MKKSLILFDLDGTLLPMDQEDFVKAYFTELTKKFAPDGYEPRALIDAVWAGTHQMVGNDGTATNEAVFWSAFSAIVGPEILTRKADFDCFYQNEFDTVKRVTGENRLAREAVALARERAEHVVLATNPIFPLCAVKTRLSWIGLSPDDFDYITTYENARYCKPNPAYFQAILQQFGCAPADALMVGNDVGEDMIPCAALGTDLFLVTDCLIPGSQDSAHFPQGSFSELLHCLQML